MKIVSLITSMLILLSACATSTTNSAPLYEQLAGKTITTPTQNVTLNADGTMKGMVGQNLDMPLSGAWAIRDGKFCRTITTTNVLPPEVPATECQDVTIVGDQATFTSPTGRGGTVTLS